MKLKKAFAIIALLLVVLMAGCKKDDDTGVRPMVTSTDPINNVTGVARNKSSCINLQ